MKKSNLLGDNRKLFQGIGLILLILCSEAWAVDHCVTQGGTATAGGCESDTCTEVEWQTPNMCYPATSGGIARALVAAAFDGDGSTVTLDDGAISIQYRIVTEPMPASGGTVVIRCRTPARGSCWVTSSEGSHPIWALNDTDENDFTFLHVGCTRSTPVINTGIAAGCINANGPGTGNITLDSVYWHDIHFDLPGVSASCCAVINVAATLANKTLTIKGSSLFENISYDASAVETGLIRMLGEQDLHIKGLTVKNFSTIGVKRAIDCNDTCTISNLVATWNASEADKPNIINAFIFSDEPTSIITVKDSTFSNSNISGVSPHAGFIYVRGPTYISRLLCSNNTISATEVRHPSTACIFGTGDSATLTVVDYVVENNVAQYGGGFYLSQGASGVFIRPVVTGTSVKSGILGYCGGWGDCTIISALVYNNTQLPDGEKDFGGIWYCQLHSAAKSDRTCSLYESTIVNNGILWSAPGSIVFANNVSDDTACDGRPCQQRMTIQDSAICNGKSQEIHTYTVWSRNSVNVLAIINSMLTDKDDPTSHEPIDASVSETLIGNVECDG